MTELKDMVLRVPEISCEHCVHAINGSLSATPGVQAVNTDIPTKTVSLTFDPSQLSLGDIETILDDIGYTVTK
jgi:copper chaperone CopZ